MRALVWKEYREKRIWLAVLAASTVALVLWNAGYTFVGEGSFAERLSLLTGWVAVPALLALFMGAGSYASEVDAAAQFLFTRPVSWRRVLLAKIIVGVGVIFLAAAAAALVFRILCPEPYLRFATFGRLGVGVGFATLLMGIGYIAGLACSPVLPSTAGGILVLAAVYLAMGALAAVGRHVFGHHYNPIWTLAIGWPIGMVLGMFLVLRRGITRPVGVRIVRFAVPLVVAMGLCLPLDLARPKGPVTLIQHVDPPYWQETSSIGPGGRFAVTRFPDNSYHLVDRARGKSWSLHVPADDWGARFTWADENTVCYLPYNRSSGDVVVWHAHSKDRPVRRKVEGLSVLGSTAVLVPSPDGRRAMLAPTGGLQFAFTPNGASGGTQALARPVPGFRQWVAYDPGWTQRIHVLDLKKARLLARHEIDADSVWWQSESEIGYRDSKMNRHILQVPNAE